MKEPAGTLSNPRRTFLKAAVVAGGAGALAPVIAAPSHVSAGSGASPDSAPAAQSRGYRESAHVRAYYRTLRE